MPWSFSPSGNDEEILRVGASQRKRKPFSRQSSFCRSLRFVLDSSFMENARMAASRALSTEALTAEITEIVMQNAPRRGSGWIVRSVIPLNQRACSEHWLSARDT
jgi:hypothetical protein